MLIVIGDRILLTNSDFQSRNAKITRFWNRVVMVLHLFSSLDFGTESIFCMDFLEGFMRSFLLYFLKFQPKKSKPSFIWVICVFSLDSSSPVSYTHLTLPTNREV